MKWIYKGETFEPEDNHNLYGFIYKLYYELNDAVYGDTVYTYIGKKQFKSYVELDALKNGSKRDGHIKFQGRNKNGKRIQRELIAKDSNWRAYTGSCKDVRIEDMILVEKEIIHMIPFEDKCKQSLSYWEEYYLHTEEVLFDEYNLNANISGRYFKDNLIKGIK